MRRPRITLTHVTRLGFRESIVPQIRGVAREVFTRRGRIARDEARGVCCWGTPIPTVYPRCTLRGAWNPPGSLRAHIRGQHF